MSAKIAVVSLFAVLVAASALPARLSDTELIDPKYGDQPIVDTGVIAAGGGGFFDSSFDIFRNMESVMRRMREQMNALLNGFGSANSTIPDVGDFSGFGLPAIPDLDLGKGNTTSVTKVIDGHKVVINETKYSNENANGGAFFKVRVIEVKPEKPDEEPEATTKTIPRDVEPLENSQENEISKQGGSEDRYGNLEPLEDLDYTLPSKIVPIRSMWRDIEDFDEDNRIDGPLAQPFRPVAQPFRPVAQPFRPVAQPFRPVAQPFRPVAQPFRPVAQPFRPYDLSNDINVNYILAKKNYPINPDSEFIQPEIGTANDLSRDIWVNQLMADQPYVPNPDVEVFQNKPKAFEKFINPR